MRFKKLEVLLNIVFWIITSWLIISINSIEAQGIEIVDGEKVKSVIRSKELVYLALSGQVLLLIMFYLVMYLIQQLGVTKKIRTFILKTIVLLFMVLLLYEITSNLIFPNFSSLSGGIGSTLIFYLAMALGYGFIKMWFKNEQDKQQLELIKNRAELNLLKSQLHPHFLFNTMNNLLAMVNQRDNPKLAQSIDKLSTLLRYVVYDTKNEKVAVKDEVTFIRNFAELHLLRFEEDEVDIEIDIKGTFDQQKIEPGIFLCYIENAFKHGVQPEEKAFIHISLDITKKDRIVFQVVNSIPTHIFPQQKGGFGMASNEERLNLAYPNMHTIRVESNENYSVELKIASDESNNS